MSISKENFKEYRTWLSIKTRCYNAKSNKYKWYGAKGIIMSDAWRNDFAQFLADMGKRPSDKHSIDRTDTLGIYEAGNCKWVTHDVQMRNRGDWNVILTYEGKTQCAMDWSIELGLPFQVIISRKNKLGWSDDKILSTPNLCRRHKVRSVIDVNSSIVYDSIREASKAVVVNENYLSAMLCGKRKNKTSLMFLEDYNKKSRIQLPLL